ncbi:hypothetical protein Q765_15605 [Flavobacterium rivuli WB 3.3-2 = DSM 21788]|uniref:Lipoprotein n=1 Tax=Flavobacterium rivuli WB 3.3-2 = DSM 21788 TaxID=1121895 RepID=A0A0A2M048_9FLAO|nr:hypothetical protein [Flavobacterium rivuli]KGO85634.1 hypothetical protein Q765_15605 [Flavobacterium rivuli WB 3.3-2 = DSM 21788]
MKKIIAILVVMLGFGFTANAQQKRVSVKSPTTGVQAVAKDPVVEQAATKDLTALTKVVTLNDVEKQNFKGLFEYKHRELKKALTPDQKKVLLNSIDAKLRASLTPDQMAKLDANKKTLTQLTN